MPDLHISKSNVSSPQMSPALDTVDTEQDPMMVSPPWLTAKPATSPTSKLKKLRLKVELETNLREVWSFATKEKAQVGAFTVIVKSSRRFVSTSGSRGRITRRGAMASGARMWRRPTESRTKISREQWSRDRWSEPEIHFFIKTTFRFLPGANDFYLVGAKLEKLNEVYPSSSGWRIKWQFVKQTSHRICQTFRLKGFPHQMLQPARKNSEDVLRILRLQSKGHCGN